MSVLRGAKELRNRINAMTRANSGPIGREWGNRAVSRFRGHTPVRSGNTRRSYRVNPGKTTEVTGSVVAGFIDKGVRPHDIRPVQHRVLAFKDAGRPVFARKVHSRGYRGRPFLARDARGALDDTDIPQTWIDAWNRAG